MVFRPESRWWLATLAIVAVLVAIALLALDRPNVVWHEGKAYCPACRSEVALYATKCSACSSGFDWFVAGPDESPLCAYDLSGIEAEEVHLLLTKWGHEEAAKRVAAVLGSSLDVARDYLGSLGRGRCGWCGGTGVEPVLNGSGQAPDCLVCKGGGACIGCGGDRRVTIGSWGAAQALAAYASSVRDVPEHTEAPMRLAEWEQQGNRFLARHAGTGEAARILHVAAAEPAGGGRGERYAAGAARARLVAVLAALRQADD